VEVSLETGRTWLPRAGRSATDFMEELGTKTYNPEYVQLSDRPSSKPIRGPWTVMIILGNRVNNNHTEGFLSFDVHYCSVLTFAELCTSDLDCTSSIGMKRLRRPMCSRSIVENHTGEVDLSERHVSAFDR
jgi:hypothetical protein